MSKLLQLRGGTTSEHSTFTGALREVTVDTTKDTLVVHDGSTAGGHALPRTAAEIVALISNDAIDSQHYAAGSIDLEHMSANSVDSDQYVDGSIDLVHMSANSVDSDQYVDGSIDLVHMSAESVDEDNLHISNAGTNGQYLQKQSANAGGLTWTTVDLTTLSAASLTSGIVPTARINASSIANDLLDSQHYAAGSIDTEHLAADSVTTAKIADSVALGGSPTTTTQSAADNSTKVATTAYADAAIAALADSAPSTLNTLNELAAALGDDANYATTTATAIGTKMPLAGGAFTGAVTTNSTFDGRDVATDGTKLDGIEASATADQTAAQIKTHLENGIDSVHYVDGSIDRVHLAADVIDSTKLANDSVNSEHYVNGSIDAVHIASNSITATQLAADCVGASELANDSVGSANIIANSITAGDIAAGAVGASEIGNDVVNSQHYAAGSIDNEHINTMAASKLTGALPAISGASLTGVDPFPSGTVMVFYQSAAPTGWTKSTAQNNKALRVVSGSGGGVGGTHGLSSPPSLAHTHTGGSHTHTSAAHTHTSAAHTHSIGAHSHGHNLSAAAHTLTTSQMPSHTHGYKIYTGSTNNQVSTGTPVNTNGTNLTSGGPGTNATGGGGSHSHGMSGSISNSSAYNSSSVTPGASGSTTPGATGASGTQTSSSTTPTAFAPQYIDVIICAKD